MFILLLCEIGNCVKLDCVKTETGDDVKNVEINFGMLKTLIEVRAEPMQEEARAPRACFDSPHIRLLRANCSMVSACLCMWSPDVKAKFIKHCAPCALCSP